MPLRTSPTCGWLSLEGPGVTDTVLAKLKITKLRTLLLLGTTVTNAGLESLGRSVDLQSLQIDGQKINDKGARHLAA